MLFLARQMRRLRERSRDDRGLAMVEMAIVAPFLALLVAGIMEYGTLWRDNLTITSATRASARVVSNLGDSYLADYEALLSLDAALATLDDVTVEGVLIYDASASDGAPHSSCFDAMGDPKASSGYCNYYSTAQLASISGVNCSVSCTEFPNNSNCAGAWSSSFCPQTDRETSQAAGTTNVGIWVRVQRDYVTGVFPGDGVTITDQTVMKVEPQ